MALIEVPAEFHHRSLANNTRHSTRSDSLPQIASIIISVKPRHLASSQIRDLRGVITREDAAIGVFITLESPTSKMRQEAAEAGFFQTKSVSASKHPRLQLLTIQDLLAGRKIDMPTAQDLRSFKQAPKARHKRPDAPTLPFSDAP